MNLYKPNRRNEKNKRTSLNKRDQSLSPRTPNERQNSNNQNGSNDLNRTGIIGNWIVAIGSIVSAIGTTPSTIFTKQTLNDFHIIGHILEGSGIALASESEDTLLYTVGDQLQAIGNITVVAGLLSANEQTNRLLERQGNLLQVVGLGLVIDTNGNLTLLQTLYNTGIIIQLIGTTIITVANEETKEGEEMIAIGSWIKVVGAIITALATN